MSSKVYHIFVQRPLCYPSCKDDIEFCHLRNKAQVYAPDSISFMVNVSCTLFLRKKCPNHTDEEGEIIKARRKPVEALEAEEEKKTRSLFFQGSTTVTVASVLVCVRACVLSLLSVFEEKVCVQVCPRKRTFWLSLLAARLTDCHSL